MKSFVSFPRSFLVSPEVFEAFRRELERPSEAQSELDRLLKTPAPWEASSSLPSF